MSDKRNQPVSIVIFGGSGDLTHRKLIPALYNLCLKNRLPDQFQILGFSNIQMDDQAYRDSLQDGMKQFAADSYSPGEWDSFARHLFYMTGNFNQGKDFLRLNQRLEDLEKRPTGRLYYLATPPAFFEIIVEQLGKANLTDQSEGWRRVVIEKPFGRDLKSAQELNKTLHKALEEDQIYRIDHYLGKETVQNILVFRFANTIFEPVWNNQYIDHIQITVAEEVGVEHRAAYYEKAGILRDMFQNHLMQLLTLIALEPPDTLQCEDLQTRKLEVLKALHPIKGADVAKDTIRGQYQGYRQEPGVAADSQIATYATLRMHIDNPRWKGVTFYLRSGKKLKEKVTEIVIQFKCPPYAVHPMAPSEEITPNILSMCIQPDEGIYIRFEAKVPDTAAETQSVEMEFRYTSGFGKKTSIPEAYERLILDALHGDLTLFPSDEQAEQSWRFIDPIIDGWQGPSAPPLQIYQPGSWGPEDADRMLQNDGCRWHIACGKEQDI